MSLMMSSCWTLRLKRRSALSMDSLSCTLTSAKSGCHLPYLVNNAALTMTGGSPNRVEELNMLRFHLRSANPAPETRQTEILGRTSESRQR